MWTIPCRGSSVSYSGTPNSSQLARSDSTCCCESGSAYGSIRVSVGTLWSWVAESQIRPPNLAAGQPQTLERLRRSHFMHEVQVDIEQVRLTLRTADQVLVPNFLRNGKSGHGRLPALDVGLTNHLTRRDHRFPLRAYPEILEAEKRMATPRLRHRPQPDDPARVRLGGKALPH